MSIPSTPTKENFDIITPFEPEYEAVKTKPNQVYFKYLGKIEHLVKGIARIKNFDRDELMQQSYLYFIQLCAQYDPYYMGHFFAFDRYMFKNLITKLRAYIQRYYSKGKREKPSEFCEIHLQRETVGDTHEMDSVVYMDYVYSRLSPRQREIVDLTVSGYKQQEIGKRLNISQSRVSVVKKRAIEVLADAMDDKHTPEEKNELRIAKLTATLYDD
jgi:RNA polymerase sigma factor (sigma-70 family)